MAIEASGNPMPRVINVDKNPAYPVALEALKADPNMAFRISDLTDPKSHSELVRIQSLMGRQNYRMTPD
jgi:hypothetical protein